MRKTLAHLGRILVGLFCAVALTFAASQMLSARVELPCDAPPGTCMSHQDCDDACWVYNGTQNGGQCHDDDDCCTCLE